MYVHPLYHWPPKSWWRGKRRPSRSWAKYNVYVHYPFCRSICDYCGYETRLLRKDTAEALSEHLIEEIAEHRRNDDFSNGLIESVFFGGGTASLLHEQEVSRLLTALSARLEPEVTFECEPGTISRRKLRALSALGVNRISICAQSFDDKLLAAITRKHSVSDVMRLVDDCVAAGFSNLHVDLMYGLPGQSVCDWERTLAAAIKLPVVHLSTYKLYVFKHGALHRRGFARSGDEDSATTTKLQEMHDLCRQICEGAGLRQYTLTEFAASERECVYLNRAFGGSDLLPIGPSAFGRHSNELWANSPYLASYGRNDLRESERRVYHLSKAEGFKRQVILGLWLLAVDINSSAAANAVAPSESLIRLFDEMSKEGIALYSRGVLSLGPAMRFRAGEVMARLAALPSSRWIAGYDENPLGCVETTERATEEDVELAAIMSSARRDPKFYQQLCTSPAEAVAQVSGGLPHAVVHSLVEEIARGPSEDRPALHPYRKVWMKVIQEHDYNGSGSNDEVPKMRTPGLS